jgi:hypothetical protein
MIILTKLLTEPPPKFLILSHTLDNTSTKESPSPSSQSFSAELLYSLFSHLTFLLTLLNSLALQIFALQVSRHRRQNGAWCEEK